MSEQLNRASVLTEALPYIKKYTGKTIVIKYGGNAMLSENLKRSIMSDLVMLSYVGVKVVLVHGGGPDINEMLGKLSIESKFIDGLRYTSDEAIDVIQMVLCGKTNKDLVKILNEVGGRAVGVSGIDANIAKGIKMEKYGNVGEVTDIDATFVQDLIDRGYIPVVSSVATQGETSLNVNADTFAAKLAVALQADHFMLLTDVNGVMKDPKDENTLIPVINIADVPKLVEDGIISGGMIPKIGCCTMAVENGVKQTTIQNGAKEHSILIELLSDKGSGTLFYK